MVSRIGRVIIAGDLLKPLDASALKEKHLSQKQQQGLTRPLRELDLLLSQVSTPRDRLCGCMWSRGERTGKSSLLLFAGLDLRSLVAP